MAIELKEAFVSAEPKTEFFHVEVRTQRQTWIDGSLWTFQNHRYPPLECGCDLDAACASVEMPEHIVTPVKAIANQLWTDSVKAAWAAHQKSFV